MCVYIYVYVYVCVYMCMRCWIDVSIDKSACCASMRALVWIPHYIKSQVWQACNSSAMGEADRRFPGACWLSA